MTNLLSAVLGLSFAAGLNAYATVLMLGVLHRLGVISLPETLAIVGTTPVIAVAAFLFVVEFIADKIPVLDSLWDGIHTFIRPAAGGLLAYGAVGNVDPQWQVIAALLGGGVALTSHAAKASTRAAANVSPEPFSNWALSLAEDILSISIVWITTSYPLIALAIVVLLLAGSIYVLWKLSRFARRVFRRAA
jgi:hypothetical protein